MRQCRPPQDIETRHFLRPKHDELPAHVHKTAGAVVLRIAHGYEVKENNDSSVRLADQALSNFPLPRKPEPSLWTWFLLVGLFVQCSVQISKLLGGASPAYRYVPDWFPGRRVPTGVLHRVVWQDLTSTQTALQR